MSNRADFTPKTKTVLAGRAGYQCSHPDCNKVTIGPGDGVEEISSIGEAAHIYSASIKGPRGQGNLTTAQLKSISNGIWLCKDHARLIDVNKGNGFTASQLIAWKNLHEEGIKREHGRQCRRLGWLSKLTIMESPIFKDHSSIELGKVTLIESLHNGSGKTAICEWLSSVSLNNNMGRWIPPRGGDLKLKVSAFVPESKEFLVSSDSSDYSIKVDSVDYPASPIPFRTYFINQDTFKNNLEETEVEHICRILKVEAHTLVKICKRIGSNKYGRVKSVALKSGDVECTLRDNNVSVTFNGLSGGEQSLVIMDLIIEKMQFLSESTPSILFIELNELNVQDFTNYFNWLNSTDVNFQTVITSHKGRVLGSKLGIIHYELVGQKPDIEVEEVKI